jgi:signal transduction histidine kinase
VRSEEFDLTGRILAGLTHELLNVFAIINESAGLLDDLLSLESSIAANRRESAQRSLDRIRNQIRRGTELSERMNTFGHSMEDTTEPTNVNDVVSLVVFLMQRFARLRKASLTAAPAPTSPTTSTHPLKLQLVLATIVFDYLNLAQPDDEIHLRVLSSTESSPVVQITVQTGPGPRSAGASIPTTFSNLDEMLNQAGLSARSYQADGEFGVELVLS